MKNRKCRNLNVQLRNILLSFLKEREWLENFGLDLPMGLKASTLIFLKLNREYMLYVEFYKIFQSVGKLSWLKELPSSIKNIAKHRKSLVV